MNVWILLEDPIFGYGKIRELRSWNRYRYCRFGAGVHYDRSITVDMTAHHEVAALNEWDFDE